MRRTRLRIWILLALALPGGSAALGDPVGARALLADDRPAEAAARLRTDLATAPGDPSLWTALGDVERLRCDLPAARLAYDRVLTRDPTDPAARAGLAECHLLDGAPEVALAHAAQGLALAVGARDARLWRVKALALVDLGRIDLGLEAARRAVMLAPSEAKAHEALARAAYRAGDMAAAAAGYRRAVALDPRAEEANLRLGNGFLPPDPTRRSADPVDAARFRTAVAALESGDLRSAGRGFERLCRAAPDDFKYRLGLGLARVAIRRQNEARFGAGTERVYRLLPAPEWERLREVLRDYGRRTDTERHAMRVAALPARPFWDALVAAGATHETFDVAASLPDAPSRADLRDQVTFDGRAYEHLRGVGGLHAATGTEKLREAAGFGFNTFAHEFAHQVHAWGLPAVLREEVDRLFTAARAEDRCLDWYAASNVEEYFAQGYEAFVSLRKRGCLKDTERHTRDELARRDPGLHAFLARHLDLGHETPESLAPFLAALP